MSLFSVRWSHELDGISRERILDSDQVNVAFDNRVPSANDSVCEMLGIYTVPKSGVVVLGNPHNGADSMALTFGTVYVMNGEGKTIAKYKLGDPKVWATGVSEAEATKYQQGFKINTEAPKSATT